MTNGDQKITPSLQRTTPRRVIRALKAKEDAKRAPWERFADYLTKAFGSFSFLAINALWFGVWVMLNTGWVPGLEPFDPYPFGLLTMIVSLEAIILSIIVLISQNRAGRVSELREEAGLQIDIIAEQELTKAMELIARLAEKQGIDVTQDVVLKEMLKPLDTNKIEKALERQL